MESIVRRRYSVTKGHDLVVVDWPDTDREQDLSEHYQRVLADLRSPLIETEIEVVIEDEFGRLSSRCRANVPGDSAEASERVLRDLVRQDLADTSAPRGLAGGRSS
jgi:hypothetical protein